MDCGGAIQLPTGEVGACFIAISWRYVFSYTGLPIAQLPVQKSLSEGSILFSELSQFLL